MILAPSPAKAGEGWEGVLLEQRNGPVEKMGIATIDGPPEEMRLSRQPENPGEFDLIERIRRRVATRADVVLGIGDDAAVVQVPAGKQLAIATDTLNSGVHFPADTAPADIGWKALAVNLSDLAAMGAVPAWCTLSLSLPQSDSAWVDAFLDGFLALASDCGIALVGGDTTRGPLSVCVTVHGLLEPGRTLRRDAARVRDDVWVSGTLGDAAGALVQWRDAGTDAADRVDRELRRRLDRPQPRMALGIALAGVAHACIDVSDGLLADIRHVCRASGVGAEIDLGALPCSPALRRAFADERRHLLQASGGDDYELCFTAPPAARDAIESAATDTRTPVTRIGRIVAGDRVSARRADGTAWEPPTAGYVHFAG